MIIVNMNSKKVGLPTSSLSVTSGNLYHLDVFSPEMNDTINVDIWTPSGYSNEMKYPVVYMHDGQNLFDAASTWNHQAWEIDSVAGQLIDNGAIKPAIIVGIYSYNDSRLGDLMPEKPLKALKNDTIISFINKMCRDNFRADEYLTFIVNTLRPIVNDKFSVDTSTSSTYIMGSSMGGLISIYGLCEYPGIFGAAACLSTHWTGALGHNTDFPSAMRNYLIENLPLDMNHRIYFDNGDCPYDTVYIPYFNQMVELVDSLGYNSDQFKHSIFPGHSHDEKSWSRRVATPLEFLLAH